MKNSNSNSVLSIYRGGMWLWDNQYNMENPSCSMFTRIEGMNDPQIAAHILVCNDYGYYPIVEFCSDFPIVINK